MKSLVFVSFLPLKESSFGAIRAKYVTTVLVRSLKTLFLPNDIIQKFMNASNTLNGNLKFLSLLQLSLMSPSMKKRTHEISRILKNTPLNKMFLNCL